MHWVWPLLVGAAVPALVVFHAQVRERRFHELLRAFQTGPRAAIRLVSAGVEIEQEGTTTTLTPADLFAFKVIEVLDRRPGVAEHFNFFVLEVELREARVQRFFSELPNGSDHPVQLEVLLEKAGVPGKAEVVDAYGPETMRLDWALIGVWLVSCTLAWEIIKSYWP